MINDWIEYNLPWQVRLPWTDIPDPPRMEDRIREHFAGGKMHWEEEFFPDCQIDDDHFLTDHSLFQQYAEIRDELERDFSSSEVKEKLEANPHPAVRAVFAYRAKRAIIDAWVEEQPEWIAYVEERERKLANFKAFEAKHSFCGAGLNRAGTLIEIEQGGKLVQMMIGTINELGGACDDCRGISDGDIIRRYKVLWSDQDG